MLLASEAKRRQRSAAQRGLGRAPLSHDSRTQRLGLSASLAEEGTERILAKANRPHNSRLRTSLRRFAASLHAVAPRSTSSRVAGAAGTSSNGTWAQVTSLPSCSASQAFQTQTGCIRWRCSCFALRLQDAKKGPRVGSLRTRVLLQASPSVGSTANFRIGLRHVAVAPVRRLRRGLAFWRHGTLRVASGLAESGELRL